MSLRPPFICLTHSCPKHEEIDHRVGLYTLDETTSAASCVYRRGAYSIETPRPVGDKYWRVRNGHGVTEMHREEEAEQLWQVRGKWLCGDENQPIPVAGHLRLETPSAQQTETLLAEKRGVELECEQGAEAVRLTSKGAGAKLSGIYRKVRAVRPVRKARRGWRDAYVREGGDGTMFLWYCDISRAWQIGATRMIAGAPNLTALPLSWCRQGLI